MKIEVCTVGGFKEVGKNMTAIKIGDEVVLVDMGLYIPAILEVAEEERVKFSSTDLIKIGAIPDDSVIKDWKKKVKAIVCGHCHLDHTGALPFLASKYKKAPIIGTPYTIEVIKAIFRDEKKRMFNKLKPLSPNSCIKISDNISIELINVTHSTLQAAMIAIYTPRGTILYANDFKLDNNPVLGNKPNYKRLKELGKEGVLLLIVEAIYAAKEMKTPSEKVARELLKEVMLTVENKGKAVFVTTFASHLARIKSMIDFGERMKREIIILGRSMGKYIHAAENLRLVDFSKRASIYTYKSQIGNLMNKISRNRGRYLVICTGNQGEPNSILDRIIKGDYKFNFREGDHVIFSCKIIPQEQNIAQREELERRLRSMKVRIFTNIHVSVLPATEVVVNDGHSMRLKKIEDVDEHSLVRVAGFDPISLKVGWYDASLVKHLYSGSIYNIKTKSGRRVGITSGHSIFVLENNQVVEKKGCDLKEGDFVAIPKRFEWDKTLDSINIMDYIPFKKNVFKIKAGFLYYNHFKITPLNIEFNSDFAKVLGYYLAEGSAPRHLSFVFSSDELDLLNSELIPALKACFPSKFKVYQKEKSNSIELCFGARILGRLFKQWFGKNAKKKRIPGFVFSANKEFKLRFLGAYLNGDGTMDKLNNRIRIKTASEKLASDFLYLFSQVGICAKFDHEEVQPPRFIAGNKKLTPSTRAFVLRIQHRNDLTLILPYLSDKFKKPIEKFLSRRNYTSVTYPPLALPICHLNFDEIVPKKGSYLHDLKKYKINYKKPPRSVSYEILRRDSSELKGMLKKFIDGDLYFDSIKSIDISNYNGYVYDFRVPGVENFIGGFGGVFLHNSGHSSREDLRDFIDMVKPKHIVPAHGEVKMESALGELAEELGYKPGKTVHVMVDGQKLKL